MQVGYRAAVTHHRWLGLVVVASVAVVLIAGGAGLRPHVVSGVGQAAPVLGPPAVGDCVLDPLADQQEGVVATVTATSGGTVPVYPAQQIQPCTAARYGEIVAVIAAPKPTVVKKAPADGPDNFYLDDPNEDSCYAPAVQYVGIAIQPVERFFQPFLEITMQLSRPSARQAATGQRWAACIVTLASQGWQSAAPQYGGSIRDALHTGQQRDKLGNCISSTNWDDGFSVDGCRQPHSLEVMGFGDSGAHVVTRAQVEKACQQLVRRVTGIVDPTAAGALSVQVHVDDNSGIAITTTQIPANSNLACGITTTGHRQLRGSLLALGRQPISWA